MLPVVPQIVEAPDLIEEFIEAFAADMQNFINHEEARRYGELTMKSYLETASDQFGGDAFVTAYHHVTEPPIIWAVYQKHATRYHDGFEQVFYFTVLSDPLDVTEYSK